MNSSYRRFVPFAALLMVPLACGFFLKDCHGVDPGGLKASDFTAISEIGFDPADHQVDRNEYAWSMDFFQADGADEGYIYVGTANRLGDWSLVRLTTQSGNVPDAFPDNYPEIRRYRPDLGEKNWETVFDFRDESVPPEFATIGFRSMTTYYSPRTETTYLYAATMGENPQVWRSATGEYGEWEEAFQLDSFNSFRGMAEHDGLLYMAVAADDPWADAVASIFATDGVDVWEVVGDGFGNPDNREAETLISFNGWLYVGLANFATGGEIWKMAGPDKQAAPVQVVANGGPDPRNENFGTPAIFNGQLYMGSLLFVGGYNPVTKNGFKGFDMVRINPDDTWETVVGPNSISGYDSGFNQWTNAYCWQLEPHGGWLYCGTYDMGTVIGYMLQNPELLSELGGILGKQNLRDWLDAKLDAAITDGLRMGADMFKTQDGETWYPVTLDALGDVEPYGFRTLLSHEDYLYAGSADVFRGLKVWRATAPAVND